MKSDYQSMTPAEKAAQEALNCIFDCIKNHKSFILEAGAGAGKTYSLIHALKFLIKNHGIQLMRRNQKIACITYTNVAKDEIKARTDSRPVIVSETIHSFCWSLLKDFQPKLRSILPQLKNWNIRIE
jgi:DNA helicase-2/ATP-dependent DNA helicase PcrA